MITGFLLLVIFGLLIWVATLAAELRDLKMEQQNAAESSDTAPESGAAVEPDGSGQPTCTRRHDGVRTWTIE